MKLDLINVECLFSLLNNTSTLVPWHMGDAHDSRPILRDELHSRLTVRASLGPLQCFDRLLILAIVDFDSASIAQRSTRHLYRPSSSIMATLYHPPTSRSSGPRWICSRLTSRPTIRAPT